LDVGLRDGEPLSMSHREGLEIEIEPDFALASKLRVVANAATDLENRTCRRPVVPLKEQALGEA
jgi:hypothetical protein